MSGGGGGGGAAATDHYEVLEVSETSDHGDIRKAYFRLAMKYHPDKNPDNREWATERFKAISEAYAVLSDEAQRKQYDEMRQGLGDGARPFTHTHTTEDNTTNFDAFSNMRPGAVDPFQMFNAFFSREFGVSLDDDMGFASSGRGGRDPFDAMFQRMDEIQHDMGMGMMGSGNEAMGMGGFMWGMGGMGMGEDIFANQASAFQNAGASEQLQQRHMSSYSHSFQSAGTGSGGLSQSSTTRSFLDDDGNVVTETSTTTTRADGQRETVTQRSVQPAQELNNRLEQGGQRR
uniref:J domain-containing protein n=4 Tax=Phaeomonas parva TaxID=124430 RepID=A0A7S1UI03_9STRA|mmetsp:Transcript_6569/g.18610  ORF Transcript_6569/g.18610 Transcript_6569/m.18610 type:complete len:289 (+) Transcript_6569:298-1164(+)